MPDSKANGGKNQGVMHFLEGGIFTLAFVLAMVYETDGKTLA
jgi:hypothetical protein